jgi:hypothetical protein
MSDKIKTILFGFGVLELISVVINIIYGTSWMLFVSLLFLNVILILFTVHYSLNQLKNLSLIRNVDIERKIKLNSIINFVTAIILGFYSILFFPKFYFVSFVLFIAGIILLSSTKLLKRSLSHNLKNFNTSQGFTGFFYGLLFLFAFPFSLDLHNLFLVIPNSIYIILASGYSLLAGIGLWYLRKNIKRHLNY